MGARLLRERLHIAWCWWWGLPWTWCAQSNVHVALLSARTQDQLCTKRIGYPVPTDECHPVRRDAATVGDGDSPGPYRPTDRHPVTECFWDDDLKRMPGFEI